MKLNAYQFDQHLKGELAPIYLISGEEPLLKYEILNTLRKRAEQLQFSERIRISPEAGYDWNQLYHYLHGASLLAEKRVIELDFRDALPNKLASQILSDYAAHLDAHTLLILDLNKLDDKIYRSAWYKALEKAGVVLTLWPLNREQLPQWILKRAQKYKLNLSHDCVQTLIELVEGNLSAAAQTLEKLYLLRPDSAITPAMISHLLSNESRFSIFDLADAIIAREQTRSLQILQSLQADDVELVIIIWSLAREIRLLVSIYEQLAQGKSFDSIMQKQRVFSKKLQHIKQFIQKQQKNSCEQALIHLAEIDKMAKGAQAGNPWQALQMLCLRLTDKG